MSIAYVDTSVSTAIAFDKPGAAAHAQRLSEVTRLISSKQLETELRGVFARENPLFVEIAGTPAVCAQRLACPPTPSPPTG